MLYDAGGREREKDRHAQAAIDMHTMHDSQRHHALVTQPAVLTLARGSSSYALSLSHCRAKLPSDTLRRTCTVYYTTCGRRDMDMLVLCLCDPCPPSRLAVRHCLCCTPALCMGLCVPTGLPARQEVVRGPTSSAIIMSHHGL